MARHFTLKEAERLLAELEPLLRKAISQNAEYSIVESEIQEFSQRVAMLGGAQVDRRRHLAQRGRRDALAAQLRESIETIQQSGCLIKDLDIGLLDFPTRYRGEEVYLCWRIGEPAIRHWHGIQEGFRNRKAIDDDFLRNHQGDLPS